MGATVLKPRTGALAVPEHVLQHRAVLVDARRRAVQRSGRDLYRRGAGLPAAKMSGAGARPSIRNNAVIAEVTLDEVERISI